MAKTLTPPEALHRAAALCSSSEHCITDIREKLSRWGIGELDARTIVNDSFKKDSSMKKDTPLLSPKTNSVFPGGDE